MVITCSHCHQRQPDRYRRAPPGNDARRDRRMESEEEMALMIKPTGEGYFAIDDGTQLLLCCPHCLQAMDERTAKGLVERIRAGRLDAGAADRILRGDGARDRGRR